MYQYEKKRKRRNSVIRLVISLIGFIFQTLWIIILVYALSDYSWVFAGILRIVSIIVVIKLFNDEEIMINAKMVWIILILAFPIAGITLYILYGRQGATRRARRRYHSNTDEIKNYFKTRDFAKVDLDKIKIAVEDQFRYVQNERRYFVYKCKNIQYYNTPINGLYDQIEAIKRAKSFIFIETYAIEDEKAFSMLLEPLKERSKSGVEVRIIYDDIGSLGFLQPGFVKKLEAYGIKAMVFNQVNPGLNIFMQNRDHRKIMVIDGVIGFTGGYNYADEYFGFTHPYGEWKDTGICFDGPAVNAITELFLEMWNTIKKTDVDVSKYFCTVSDKYDAKGYIQPYADNPLCKGHLAENVYLNIIKNSKKYVYIMTPYLIIGSEMIHELVMAAKRGVDVRIITPGVPDKKIIYSATRSFYNPLLEAGVKIYEFAPGFLHAKQFLSDDEIAVCGTVNLDYRSLCHHFENAVLMYNVPIISHMKKDFEDTFTISKEVIGKKYIGLETIFLRFISPLL